MRSDSAEIPPDASLEADVAVVGAGPAGIVVALELARAGRRVLLIESGGDGFDRRRSSDWVTLLGRIRTHVAMSLDHQPPGRRCFKSLGWTLRAVRSDRLRAAADRRRDRRWPVDPTRTSRATCREPASGALRGGGLRRRRPARAGGRVRSCPDSPMATCAPARSSAGRCRRTSVAFTGMALERARRGLTAHAPDVTCTEVIPCDPEADWSVEHLRARRGGRSVTIRA